MDEQTLALIDEGLANLCEMADKVMAERDGDLYLAIDDLTRALRLSGASMPEVAGFCAFAALRMRGHL
jgi:hypothetical protein